WRPPARWRHVIHQRPAGHRGRGGFAYRGMDGWRDTVGAGCPEGGGAGGSGHHDRPRVPLRPGRLRQGRRDARAGDPVQGNGRHHGAVRPQVHHAGRPQSAGAGNVSDLRRPRAVSDTLRESDTGPSAARAVGLAMAARAVSDTLREPDTGPSAARAVGLAMAARAVSDTLRESDTGLSAARAVGLAMVARAVSDTLRESDTGLSAARAVGLGHVWRGGSSPLRESDTGLSAARAVGLAMVAAAVSDSR